MDIQWFPGHMAKSRKLLSDNIKIIDVIIEILDARIPSSSRNPEFEKIAGQKPRLFILNKSDLADEKVSGEWKEWYSSKGYTSIFMDSVRGKGIKELKDVLQELMRDRFEKERQKGRRFRPIRTMVVGIPNVGKSSFINRIAGKASAVTGDRPGITRGKQWIKVDDRVELLDTPGILWPKFDDRQAGLHLAFTGAVRDDVFDTVEAASLLIEQLKARYPVYIAGRYKLTGLDEKSGEELLLDAGRNRGCITSGNVVDMNRIAAIVLDEFRGGKIGRISLERPGRVIL